MPPQMAWLTRILRHPIKHWTEIPLDLNVWGLRLRLLPKGNVSEQKLYTAPQLFDRDEFIVMSRDLVPGSIFVDIGANAGVYSFWAHRCMQGQGRIIAVEPDPEMMRRLTFNRNTNQLNDIELYQVALSDQEGVAKLLVNPRQRGKNTLEHGNMASDTRSLIDVRITTLLELLQSCNVDRVDVLKIDIEGHELPVFSHFFQHAPQELWPRILIAESKHEKGDQILRILDRAKYRLRKKTETNSIFERN